MFRIGMGAVLLFLLAACGPLSAAPTRPAASPAVLGGISVSDAWVRNAAVPGGAAAAYMHIDNSGPADRLLSISSDVAAIIELHQSSESNGMMQMSPVPAIPIPQGGQVQLKPGGYHAMLMNLSRPLKVGEQVTLELNFETAGNGSNHKLAVTADVRE